MGRSHRTTSSLPCCPSLSLEHGPAVLNSIHDTLEFSEEATVVATQRDRLPRTPRDDDTDWILDWVVEDTDELVGYESKTGNAVPSDAQLDGELRKLERNSGGRTTHLYVFTDHPTNPLSRTDVEWLSWYDVAERVQAFDPDTDSIRMLQRMFENENYETFSGFEPFEQTREWFARHDEHVVELAFELHRQLSGIDLYTRYDNTVPHHATTTSLSVAERNRSISLNQSVHIIPFHPQDHPEHVDAKYHPVLLIPAIRNELFVAHHVHAVSDDAGAFVEANQDRLAELVTENGMTLRTS